MRNLIFAMAMCGACAPEGVTQDFGDGGTGTTENLTYGADGDNEAVRHMPYEPGLGMGDVDIDPEVPFEGMSPEELNALWFGDSGWDCCWTPLCVLLSERCEDDEVMTTNGAGTVCCTPSIGQCSEDLRPTHGSDAGQ